MIFSNTQNSMLESQSYFPKERRTNFAKQWQTRIELYILILITIYINIHLYIYVCIIYSCVGCLGRCERKKFFWSIRLNVVLFRIINSKINYRRFYRYDNTYKWSQTQIESCADVANIPLPSQSTFRLVQRPSYLITTTMNERRAQSPTRIPIIMLINTNHRCLFAEYSRRSSFIVTNSHLPSASPSLSLDRHEIHFSNLPFSINQCDLYSLLFHSEAVRVSNRSHLPGDR